MTNNVGPVDKTIRILLGLGIGAAGLYFNSWWGLVGLVPLATAFMGFCPVYLPFKISTAKKAS